MPMSRVRIDMITSGRRPRGLNKFAQQDPLNEIYIWHRLLYSCALDVDSGCWIWLRTTNGRYGHINIRMKKRYVHRLMYEITRGSIPKGNFICHKCDNPRCINPAHLFTGTHNDNMKDASVKGRMNLGENHGSSKLTAKDILLIREMLNAGEKQSDIAQHFGVCQTNISHINLGKSWSHVK